MLNRIQNTIFKKVKINIIAKILSRIIYAGIYVFYIVARLFARGKISLDPEEARRQLNSTSAKPNMDYSVKNESISKDLSIIVPAYNSEKTIEQCINSVITQETKYDYELIVINDGSTDRTKEIVEKFNDEKIVLINQENRGFSGARNRGIDECVGKYIMFLDSDDYLIGNCIESMMNNITETNASITQASYAFVYEGNSKKEIILPAQVIDNTEKMVSHPGFPWAKIYKRELFEQVRFPLDVWFEDTIVCMLLFRMSQKVSVMSEVVYGYYINPEGITNRIRDNKKCIDHYWVMEHCLEKAKQVGLANDELQYEIVKKHMSTLMYRRIGKMDEATKKSAFVLASQMLEQIRPKDYKCCGNLMERDLEKAFEEGYYKLWKLASFVV